MSAATSRGTGLAYGLRRVCAAWGMARSSFYAMTSGHHVEQPPAKLRGPKPAISDQALLVAIEAVLEASPFVAEGYRKVWATASGLSRHPGCPQSGAPPDAREQSALAPSHAAAVAAIPMTVRSSLMPRTSCGAPMAFGCSRWTTAGARSSPPSSNGTPSVIGWHVCKRGYRFAALQPISMGLVGLYGLDRGRRGSGAGLADGSRLPVSVGTTSPTRSSSGASSRPYAFVAKPQTNGVAERYNRTLKEQIIQVESTATSRSCGTPSATSSNSTMPTGSSKRTAT